MIVVGEILHLQGSFHDTLGLDNCVRYRCNRPRLYLTEEHSIRWKFCLVNQKLFHLNWSACKSQSLRTHRRCNQYSKIKENKLHVAVYKNVAKNIFHNVRKCTEKAILKVIWVGKGALDAILSQINKKIGDQFHFQWHRRCLNHHFSSYVTDKVNGSRIQPSLFGEDQRPHPGDGGNRA